MIADLIDRRQLRASWRASPKRFGLISWRETRHLAAESLDRLGVDVGPDALIRELSTGDRALVAIARALHRKCDVLVLDEPTATLVARDVERLFTALRGLKAQGVGILHVSHRLAEVRGLADRITVLRDGSVVATRPAGSSERELARLILGRDVAASITAEAVPSDSEDVLRIEGMADGTGPGARPRAAARRGPRDRPACGEPGTSTSGARCSDSRPGQARAGCGASRTTRRTPRRPWHSGSRMSSGTAPATASPSCPSWTTC